MASSFSLLRYWTRQKACTTTVLARDWAWVTPIQSVSSAVVYACLVLNVVCSILKLLIHELMHVFDFVFDTPEYLYFLHLLSVYF